MAEQVAEFRKAGLPTALKGVLERLPSAEAMSVLDEIGKTAWIVDHNNNNNNSKKTLEDLQNLSKDDLIKIVMQQRTV